jgi:hypothetical protein
MGQCTVPPNVRYAYAVAAASQRSVALVDDGPPSHSVRPTALAFEDGALSATIPALRGQAYFLETKAEWEHPAWRLVHGVVACGPSATLVDQSTTESHRFYFIRPRLR